MKKIYSILICLFVFIPSILCFASCGEVKTFAIEIKTSDASSGSVNSVDGTYAEGTKIKLRATPLLDSNFLCWTLNGSVISDSAEYEITISNESQGRYVAIFDKGCQYYAVTEVVYQGSALAMLDTQIEAGPSITSTKNVFSKGITPVEIDRTGKNKQKYTDDKSFYNKALIEADFTKEDYYCNVKVSMKTTDDESASIIFNDNSVSIASLFDTDEKTFDFFQGQEFSMKVTFTKLNETIISQML